MQSRWTIEKQEQLCIGITEESTESFRDIMLANFFGFEGRLSHISSFFFLRISHALDINIALCVYVYIHKEREKEKMHLIANSNYLCMSKSILFFTLCYLSNNLF